MNLKVNLFFHLYKTPFTPFGFPTLIVSRLSAVGWVLGGVIMLENNFALKYISGEIKCFETIYIWSNMLVLEIFAETHGIFKILIWLSFLL